MVGDNRLVALAAEVRAAHGGVLDAARTAAERAIEAGRALLEAKELVRHGQWLPWLKEHCDLPERTAQLYMKIAKLDLEPEIIAEIGLQGAAQTLTVFHDQGYDVWLGCDDEQKRDWLLLICFGVHYDMVEWLRQKGFLSPDEWHGEEGAKCRRQWGLPEIPERLLRAWEQFRLEHKDMPLSEVGAWSEKTQVEQAERDDRAATQRGKSATVADLARRRRKRAAA